MKKEELLEELSRQLEGQLGQFVGQPNTKATINQIFNATKDSMSETITSQNFTMRLVKCVNGHHKGSQIQQKDGTYRELVKIDGKPLCESCERMFRLQHEVAGIDEHSSFEDYVESQIVLENMGLED